MKQASASISSACGPCPLREGYGRRYEDPIGTSSRPAQLFHQAPSPRTISWYDRWHTVAMAAALAGRKGPASVASKEARR
jgi:hypothetical protein